jgi:hypothetical protein
MFSLIFGGVTSLATSLLTAWNKSKDVSITAIQSAGSIASAQVQAMALWIGHPLSPPSIMCYAVAFHFFKALVYDRHERDRNDCRVGHVLQRHCQHHQEVAMKILTAAAAALMLVGCASAPKHSIAHSPPSIAQKKPVVNPVQQIKKRWHYFAIPKWLHK